MLQHRLESSPSLCRVCFQSHSPKKLFSQIDFKTIFLECDDYTTAISPGNALSGGVGGVCALNRVFKDKLPASLSIGFFIHWLLHPPLL